MTSTNAEIKDDSHLVIEKNDPSWKSNGHAVVDSNKVLWIFGYGSLMWKVDFPFRRKVGGYVKGFTRRFYQGSIDHRGTPEAPGRVCTLIKNPQEVVWGYAYKVAVEDASNVIEYLDFREKNGYICEHALFQPGDEILEPFQVVFYIATPGNPSYLGPAPLDELANQIVHCAGPSGKNSEYLLNLAQAVRQLNPDHDEKHLYQLETLVKNALKFKP